MSLAETSCFYVLFGTSDSDRYTTLGHPTPIGGPDTMQKIHPPEHLEGLEKISLSLQSKSQCRGDESLTLSSGAMVRS